MAQPTRAYRIDEHDPRAPTQEEWDGMSAAERAAVVANLPAGAELSEAAPPEGDVHFEAVVRARDVLRGFFRRSGRRVWVANNLAVYYPGERMFAPDVIAIVDVEPHPRDHWTVSREGKGIDVALEITWSGRRTKDARDAVTRYAKLGIQEYFHFDRRRLELKGFCLPNRAARAYVPIVPQLGALPSRQLGLELSIEGDALRFSVAGAPIPDSLELIAALDAKFLAAKHHAEEEAKRAEEEAKRAEDLERRLLEALSELERLRGGPS
jgi:Uma2 family endonuclease